MKTLKAHVENGPEGTPLDLIVAGGEEDDLSDEERAALDASIERGWSEYKSGAKSVSAEEFIAKLRNRK